VVQELGHQHVGQQPCRGNALVDDLRRDRCLNQFLAVHAGPLAADVALHREHARFVIQLLGHILPNAFHVAAAAALRVQRLMADFTARQVCWQGLALGDLLALSTRFSTGNSTLYLTLHLGDVGVQGLFNQAGLLGVQTGAKLLAGRGELHPLEHRQLVCELVHQRLLEGHFPLLPLKELVLGRHLRHQRQQCLAHLLRVKTVDVLGCDHDE
jgi:hypothetical protein